MRADKTKNIVEIIKGSADFEKTTLTDVINARAKATSIQLNPLNSAGQIQEDQVKMELLANVDVARRSLRASP